MRCSFVGCKQKINITERISNLCRCGQIYCNKHKFEKNHNCDFYKIEKTDKAILIEKKNFINKNKCIQQKVIKI